MVDHNQLFPAVSNHGFSSVAQSQNPALSCSMTPLKALILQSLKTDGPLSDVGLLCTMDDEETGGWASIIVICCLELQNEGYIEPPANDPHSWQLSNLGLEYFDAHFRRTVVR